MTTLGRAMITGQSNIDTIILPNAFNATAEIAACATDFPHIRIMRCEKRRRFATSLCTKNDHFPKTGSGQPYGKSWRKRRAFFSRTAHESASAPQLDLKTPQVGWSGSSNSSCRQFSATCWFTARDLFIELGEKVPVGVVMSAAGGTAVRNWAPKEALASCSQVREMPVYTHFHAEHDLITKADSGETQGKAERKGGGGNYLAMVRDAAVRHRAVYALRPVQRYDTPVWHRPNGILVCALGPSGVRCVNRLF